MVRILVREGPLTLRRGAGWAALVVLGVAVVLGALGGAPRAAGQAPAPAPGPTTTSASTDTVEVLIDEIGRLEQQRDPKCYATASRLEDFMYGTPLSSAARFVKIDLQKELILGIWRRASEAARAADPSRIDAGRLQPFLVEALRFEKTPRGEYLVRAPSGESVTVSERDKRQYSAVAYALRALLAVQQDALISGPALVPLTDDAVQSFRDFVDVATLVTLARADREARLQDRPQVDDSMIISAWRYWVPAGLSTAPPAPAGAATPAPRERFATLRAITEEKLAAFEAYNQLSFPVFLRNVQVYFARYRWPSDAEEGKAFRDVFNATLVQFTADLLLEAEATAVRARHSLIRVEDVHEALQRFEPHEVNAYEDVIYFPRLPRSERVVIEAYDLDSFRDAGLHWLYLQQAISAPGFPGSLEPDPFAAELLTEGVAQFGGLVLRMAGEVAKEGDHPTLRVRDLETALGRIQERIDRDARATERPAAGLAAAGLASSVTRRAVRGEDGDEKKFFTEATAEAGIFFEHRMADWLQRLLRGYTQSRDGVARLAVPQAFGGGGIAAEDIDGDGDVDLLLLSGLGNALLLNDGTGRFRDVTAESGLAWARPDGRAGEPRQPLVADFDNDGRQDILITYVGDSHRLYRNLGGHRFHDVTGTAGLGGEGSVGGPAVAFDYDSDGLLDLYVGYFGDYPNGVYPTLARRNENGLPDKLFRNLGDLRFADASAGSGVENPGWAQAATHTDFDRDGRQDLIVGNDFGVNAWYRNLGGGRFVDVAAELGTDKPSYTMGLGVTDLNRDGFPDLYVSNIVTMNKDEKYILPDDKTPMKLDPQKLATLRIVEANDLFLSRAANGRLVEYVLSKEGIGRGENSTGWAWGAPFLDFDNDGDDDLYCLNGMNEFAVYSSTNPYFTDQEGKARDVLVPVYERESNVFFENRDGKLWNESSQSGADWLGNSRAAAPFDADGDGDLDIALNNFQAPAVFYRNNSQKNGHHWIQLRLEGDPKKGVNRDAIGARIEVKTRGLANLSREVRSAGAYLTVEPKEQHLGLGLDARADLVVVWPNGERQSFERVAADRRYVLRQGGSLRPLTGRRPS